MPLLSRSERRWWPYAPLLLLQAVWVRLWTRRLPASRAQSGITGRGTHQRTVIGIGDSIVAGVGVRQADQALVAQLAATLAGRLRSRVQWQTIGLPGADSLELLEIIEEAAPRLDADLVLISCGVNDAIRGCEPAQFRERLQRAVDRIASTQRHPAIVFAGIPPLECFPALPWPLSRLLGERARRLRDQAIALTGYRGLRVVIFPDRLAAADFARDGFHPGPAACANWAGWIADGLTLQIERWGS
jgi:lysophospholipase L1-like esterase